jgi:hypothetical protein
METNDKFLPQFEVLHKSGILSAVLCRFRIVKQYFVDSLSACPDTEINAEFVASDKESRNGGLTIELLSKFALGVSFLKEEKNTIVLVRSGIPAKITRRIEAIKIPRDVKNLRKTFFSSIFNR